MSFVTKIKQNRYVICRDIESVNVPATGLLADAGTARDGRLARGPA